MTEHIVRLYLGAKQETKPIHVGFFQKIQNIINGEHTGDLVWLVNFTWVTLQERTPVFYRDAEGFERIAILGGFPNTVVPLGVLRWPELNFYLEYREFSKALTIFEELVKWKSGARQIAAKREFETLLKILTVRLNLPAGASMKAVRKGLFEAHGKIRDAFEQTQNTLDVQQTWRRFAQKILHDESVPQLAFLKPQVHRMIVAQMIRLLDVLLSSN